MTWAEQAENWIAWARTTNDGYSHYSPSFFELLPPPGGRAIELGCGEGRVARDLRHLGHEVVGIDAVSRLVEAAAEADPAGEYVVADAAALPFANESFDLVVAYNSLMDIDDMEGAVREAWRVLRPGSRLCVCVTHFINDAGWFEPDSADGVFFVNAYRGRRRYDQVWERTGVSMRFVGWCYPLESYTRALEDAGFLIEAIREPVPSLERISARPKAARRLRIPNFLMLRAVKPA
jgi:ubiquinone/menaquinone biosynthesis C-methylase UbiE